MQKQQCEIIKLILAQSNNLVEKLDFLALFRSSHLSSFRSSITSMYDLQGSGEEKTKATLDVALRTDQALEYDGRPTPIKAFRSLLVPFLEKFIPGMGDAAGAMGSVSCSELFFWAE